MYSTFIPLWILLRMRNVSDKCCGENQKQHFVFNKVFFLLKSYRLWNVCIYRFQNIVLSCPTLRLHCFLPFMKYLLTYSMVQSPSWEANCFAASQEIPRISRNPKVHYRTHKRPPPVPILVQPNPVHIPTSHFLEIRPNIIHPSTPRSPQWSLSLLFPHQDPIHPPLLTHTRHMPSPAQFMKYCLKIWHSRIDHRL